MHPLHCL